MARRPCSTRILPEPLWRQAADLIAHQIATGRLGAGGRIPAERDLLIQLSISRVTLRRALQTLVDEGVLTASHGRGWYVSADVPKEHPEYAEIVQRDGGAAGAGAVIGCAAAAEAPATLDEAEELGIAAGSPLFHLDRIRQLDGVPVAVDMFFLRGLDEAGHHGG